MNKKKGGLFIGSYKGEESIEKGVFIDIKGLIFFLESDFVYFDCVFVILK